MQKRVRKNSDYICPKKPKLDIAVSVDQEKNDANAVPLQYIRSKENDTESESLVQGISSAECSEYSNINVKNNKSPIGNSTMKTFGKSEISENESVEFKDTFQKVIKYEEGEENNQSTSDVISSSPGKNIYSGNMLSQENSEGNHDQNLNSKKENDSVDSLSNFKLLHRENDILIDFETNTAAIESPTMHTMSDSNSVFIPTEKEIITSESVSIKDSIIIKKSLDSTSLTLKSTDENISSKVNSNLVNNNSSHLNAHNVEVIPSNEKKKIVGGQTTAKVSIGNTTLSVPLLNDGKTVPNLVRKVINIRGKKIRAPTIVQLSQLQLNNKTNTKIVQATLVGNKIQLPNIGFKSSPSFIKSNLVPSSPMALTTLPKQIFDDEMVIVEKPNQPQGQNTEDCDLKSTESSVVSNVSNKSSAKPKEANANTKSLVQEDFVPKTNASYLTQLCVIDADTKIHTKSFESTLADSIPTSITVTSSAANDLPKVSATVAKSLRKPVMFTKQASTSEIMSGTTAKDLCDVLNANMPKENQQLSENITFSKKLEDNSQLRKQIALAVHNSKLQLKVSKVVDDSKMKRGEKSTDFVGICNTKRQLTKLNPVINQTGNSETILVTNIDKVEKSNNSKSEETQNVLLKHLLQSSINQRSSTTCSQTMAPRKLATVRAPSLGVVSSLEAQLARPVIPPVSSVGEIKSEIKLPNKNTNEKLKKSTVDRENINIKSRPEMISRETSFVSTFSPRQKLSTNPSETEKKSSIQTNTSQSSETDNNKVVQLQTSIATSTSVSASTSISTSTLTPTNCNYNAINLFKFFKQKEETKSQPNTSPIQNKMRSPDENSDNIQLLIKKEYENTGLDIVGSPTVKTKLAKMDIEQNIEMRKKFKRDYQKHKRQLLLNKEPQSHQKKKSRKLSKASEDFDEFIENKVVQMKQMFVLEVLEPLLSTFLGICSIYGYNDRVRSQVEHAYQNAFKEDFGRTNLKNLVDYYSVKPYGPNHNNKTNNVPTFQNKFYDEEFSTMNNESCDKLYNFISTLKQQSLQTSEHISLVPSSPRSSSSPSNVNYPSVKFSKHFTINADRLSPVIPYVNSNNFGVVSKKKPTHLKRIKCAYGNVETTVVLSLSSFVAKNILDILRDLDNLIHVYSPVSYKLLNNDRVNVRNIKGLYISRVKNLQRTQSTNIQNFLNGTYKCCRNCHMIIICGIVGAESNSGIKKKIMNENHFCDKYCCIQYKKKGKKYILSRKRERCIQNSKPVKQINANDNNCCNNSSYKIVGPNSFWKPSYKDKGAGSEDANEISLKMRITITLSTSKDTRRCILCNQKGDAFPDGSSRLLNYDVNKWVHLNCALWSNSVYETINGGLMNLELTMQHGLHQICSFCNQYGASIKCFKMRCGHIYHLPCAIKERCVFYKNKTIHCASHAHRMDKKNELNSIRVRRRVYIERDENRQVAAVMHHLELSNLLRIGNLTFINVGQLLPHQLEAFHTPNYIYPIGYKIVRFFWSTRKVNKRCRYICSIAEANGRPEFVIQIQEPFESDIELRDVTPKAVWQKVLEKIVALRKGQGLVQLFTEFFTGEDLFGLSEPSIVRILESLPGVESLTDYRFKYGRNPLLELPLAINPSGSARTEPKQRHIINWKKAHTQRTSSINLKLSLSPSSLVAGEVACPYSKQFVHSKSSQYRKMKQEWRNNVYLARSKIQGLGLYAARDLEKHTMVIEYIGQVIRTEVSELREKQYDLRNRGIYMFRLDEERVVDATLSGGLARYINHSCNPNCVTEIVDVDREYRIIIFAKRRINKGEELSYDYKFDIEDDAHKISCMCDAPNCRKWMN